MSFAEKHKAWLLPVLALGVGGVVYMNLKVLGKPAPSAPAAEPPPASAPTATPSAGGPAPVAGARPSPANGTDLWADLRVLESPPATLNQGSDIMTRCERPLDATAARIQGRFQPGRWNNLPRPVVVKTSTGTPAAHVPAPEAPKWELPPPVTFVARTPTGNLAWIGGKPWHEGATLPGGYRLKRVLLDRVVLEGPSGLVERPVLVLPSDRSRSPQEVR